MKRPARLTTSEYARVLYAATRRGLKYKAFIARLLQKKFSMREQTELLSELGSDVVDKIFEAHEYFSQRAKDE